jgi:hypothetical protein
VCYRNAPRLPSNLLLFEFFYAIVYIYLNLSDVKVFVVIAFSVVSILLSMNDAIIWSLVAQNLVSV